MTYHVNLVGEALKYIDITRYTITEINRGVIHLEWFEYEKENIDEYTCKYSKHYLGEGIVIVYHGILSDEEIFNILISHNVGY